MARPRQSCLPRAPDFVKVNPVATTTAPEPTRRDFLYIATGAVAAVGAAARGLAVHRPDEPELRGAGAGLDRGRHFRRSRSASRSSFNWRGHPLFVRRRTPKEIADADAVNVADLPDPLARNANLPDNAPATDANREHQAGMAGPDRRLHPSGLHADRFHAAGAARRLSAAGSATATARNTTPPAASAKVRRRRISRCRPTPSCPPRASKSAEEHPHVRSFDLRSEIRFRALARFAPAARCASRTTRC